MHATVTSLQNGILKDVNQKCIGRPWMENLPVNNIAVTKEVEPRQTKETVSGHGQSTRAGGTS